MEEQEDEEEEEYDEEEEDEYDEEETPKSQGRPQTRRTR